LENLEHYIAPLLEIHDCVMIPDFGGFVLNNESGGFIGMPNEIYPPSKKISFNKNLNVNDGLLAQHIAQADNIYYSEALIKIKEQVERIKYLLSERQLLKFPGVGTLIENEEKKILFSPENARNYLKASYGLPPLLLSPIEKQVPAKIYHLPERKTALSTRKPLKINSPVAISIAASLILAFIVFIKNAQVDPSQVAKVVNAIHKKVIEQKATPNLASTSILPKISTDIFDGETKSIEPVSSTKFYVIGGSFKKEINANIMVQKLKGKGYDAEVLNTENGFFRVTYIKEQDSIKADSDLHKIKIRENQDAWLLKW